MNKNIVRREFGLPCGSCDSKKKTTKKKKKEK